MPARLARELLRGFRTLQKNPKQDGNKNWLRKQHQVWRAGALVGTGAVLGLLSSAVFQQPSGSVETRAAAEEKSTAAIGVSNTASLLSTNNGLLPDQSH